jgi:hypothetical protein
MNPSRRVLCARAAATLFASCLALATTGCIPGGGPCGSPGPGRGIRPPERVVCSVPPPSCPPPGPIESSNARVPPDETVPLITADSAEVPL